jgi:hypothetical protein
MITGIMSISMWMRQAAAIGLLLGASVLAAPQARAAGATVTPSAAELDVDRVFTDSKGNAVTGKIQGIETGGIVAIQRQGGGAVKAKIADLSLDDIKFVEDWYTAKVLSRGRGFSIRAERKEGAAQETEIMATKIKIEEVFYEVTIKSDSLVPLTGLKVVHRTYKKSAGADRGSTKERVYEEGSEEIPKIEPGKEVKVKTAKQKLESSKLDPDYRYVGGRKSVSAERIGGVWLRIYKGETLIADFADPKGLMEFETWDAPPDAKP